NSVYISCFPFTFDLVDLNGRAKETLPATFSVHERMLNSLLPPCKSGNNCLFSFLYKLPVPFQPLILCPDRVHKSINEFCMSIATFPIACTASTWNAILG